MRFLFYLTVIFALLSQTSCERNGPHNVFASQAYKAYGVFPSQAYKSHCDFSPFYLYDGVRLHRRQKGVLFVTEELFDLAEEANELLSGHIGVPLFEIRHLTDSGNGSEVYISTNKDHYELEKKQREPNSYLAYCNMTENFNKQTGEIYESDIVFNPILWDKVREISKDWKKTHRRNERFLRNYKREIKKLKNNPYIDPSVISAFEREFKEWEKQNEKSEDDLEKFEDSIHLRSLETMIHEMGHALGYQHTPNSIDNIMYNQIHENRTKTILTSRQVDAVLCAFGLPSRMP